MLECLYNLLNRDQPTWWDLLYGNHALAAQEVHELSQRGGSRAADLHVARARQILSLMLGGNRAYADGMMSEPSAKTRREQKLSVAGTPHVSLFAYPLRKCSNVRRQGTLRRTRQDNFVIDDELHGSLLSPFNKGVKEPNYAESVWITCRKKQEERNYPVIVRDAE